MNTPTPLQSQERIAGALSYIFFAIPMLMKTKTDFSMFHAKQSLMILLFLIGLYLVSLLVVWIPFVGVFFMVLRWMIHILVCLVALWAAYQAYLGNKFILPVIGEQMDTLLSKIGVLRFFSTK